MSDRIQEILTELDSTDQIVVRFMEDILVALLNKQAISLADVPRVAVQKILHRRRLRCELKQLKGGGQYVENFSQHQRGVYLEGISVHSDSECRRSVSGVCHHGHSYGLCGIWCDRDIVQRQAVRGSYSGFAHSWNEVKK